MSSHPEEVLAGGCGLLALMLAAWLVLGAIVTALAEVPGLGRHLAGVARRITPRLVHRAVTATVAGALALPAAPALAALRLPAPGQPAGTAPATDLPAPAQPAEAAPGGGAGVRVGPGGLGPGAVGPVVGPAAPVVRRPGQVVVRPGDTLWSLARATLPPGASAARIASTWPLWWRANRHVIGDDPSLIQPGQHLTAPTPGPDAGQELAP